MLQCCQLYTTKCNNISLTSCILGHDVIVLMFLDISCLLMPLYFSYIAFEIPEVEPVGTARDFYYDLYQLFFSFSILQQSICNLYTVAFLVNYYCRQGKIFTDCHDKSYLQSYCN